MAAGIGIDLLGPGRFAAIYGPFSLSDVPVLPEVFRETGEVKQLNPPGSPSLLTKNPDVRAQSLGNVVLKDPTIKALHWSSCRFSEMIAWGYPAERARKILYLVAPKALGTEVIRQNIEDGLAIVERRIAGLIQAVATATQGTRNETLYWVGIEVLSLTPRAEELLVEAGRQCGLDDREIQETIQSARARRGNQGCGLAEQELSP